MIPKLTDDAVSRLPLEAGRAELLEEIMSTVAPERPADHPTPVPNRSRGRWLAPLAAAAVVAGIAAASLWGQGLLPDDEKGTPAGAAASLDLPHGKGIVLDAPGWTVDSLGSDGIMFRNGKANLEVTSYDAEDYDSYVEDRTHIVDPPAPGQPIEVLGRPAAMWAYSPDDHTAIREVEDGRWLEIRGAGLDEAAYLELLGQLRLTSEAEFDASLPQGYVTEEERADAAGAIISDITAVSGAGFPSGTSLELGEGEALDRYQFGVEVAGAYTCAWLEAYENAVTHDQTDQATVAAGVLATSRSWPILEEMDEAGDYPEAVWDYADTVGAGEVPEGYREGLGC